MTEENTTENPVKKAEKKKQFFLTKLVIFLSLTIFGYFGFKYFQIERDKKIHEGKNSEKFDNSEGVIFDLSDEAKGDSDHDLSDLTVTELKEKGAEFVYQMLIKNQVQIEDLRSQIQMLKGEILKYKNQEKIGKMILNYADLRDKIFAGKNYSSEIKTFEIITAFDANLQTKIDKLKASLPNFLTQEKLEQSFSDIIPDLITNKKEPTDSNSVIAKIRHNISRLVVIRRIDGKDAKDVDGIIVKIENSLRDKNYQEALNAALSLDESYHDILKKFLENLNAALEVQKIDEEILNYLKSLT